MTRTNIVIDEALVEEVRQATGLTTTRDVVDFALREAVRAARIRGVRALRGKDVWQGDLDALRKRRA